VPGAYPGVVPGYRPYNTRVLTRVFRAEMTYLTGLYATGTSGIFCATIQRLEHFTDPDGYRVCLNKFSLSIDVILLSPCGVALFAPV